MVEELKIEVCSLVLTATKQRQTKDCKHGTGTTHTHVMKIPMANGWFVGVGCKEQNIMNKTTTRNNRWHHRHPTFNFNQLLTQIYLSSSLKPYCHFPSDWSQLRSSSKHQYHTLQKRPVTASLGKSYFHHGLKDCGKIPAPLPTCDRRPLLNRRSGDGNGWMVRLFSSKPPPLRQASPTEGFLQEISLHLIWHRSIRILYHYIYTSYTTVYMHLICQKPSAPRPWEEVSHFLGEWLNTSFLILQHYCHASKNIPI